MTIKFTQRVKHDGEYKEKDDTVEVSEERGRRIIEAGLAVEQVEYGIGKRKNKFEENSEEE